MPDQDSRRSRGSSLRGVLEAVAGRLGGLVVEGVGFGSRDRALLAHEGWTIILDHEFSAASKSDWTRVRCAVAATSDLRCSIQRRSVLISDIARFFGAQDIEVGEEAFDRDFVLKGTEPEGVRRLLGDERLRRLIASEASIRLGVREPSEPVRSGPAAKPAEIRLDAPGDIREVPHLIALVEIVAAMLDGLRRIGAITDAPPTPAECPHCGHQLLDQSTCPECGRAVMAPRGSCGDRGRC